MWSSAAVILVLVTLSASGARAQSSLPDASRTPGAINLAVMQKTIGETICVRRWTHMVRPPVGYTVELKRQQIAAFGYRDRRLSHYEEDHLIPLGLGGAPSDPRNLWPEPRTPPDGWGADRKDELELALNQLACSGVCRWQRPSGRLRQIGSPPISAMLDRVARPTFRTRAHGEGSSSPNRLVFRAAERSSREGERRPGWPPWHGPPRERRGSRARVLRPPPALSHPKAAISASAAWRPTVAGPATVGS